MSDAPEISQQPIQSKGDSSAPKPGRSRLFSNQYLQIVYGLVLIALIPAAIIFNTVNFVNNFSNNLDIQLQRQVLQSGQVFIANNKEIIDQPQALQAAIESTVAASPDIYSLDILYPEEEDFKVVASLDPDSLGKVSGGVNNVIAWHEEQAIAHLTNDASVSVVAPEMLGETRFWSAVMPAYDLEGRKLALLNIKMSLEVMDRQAAQTLFRAYLLLTVTVVIVILLLFLNTRMFEYARLFKKLKEVDQMKDEFISIASHELRTPITALRGYISMFSSGDFGQLNQAGSKGLKIMTSSIERLASMVEDLLNVSRIEQKRIELSLQRIDVNQALGLIIEELKLTAESKQLTLQLHAAEQLPGIMADSDKFKQIFINIIGNALKYTKQGSVLITTMLKDERVVIKVKDTGIGMSAIQRQHLFEKFYRVKSDQTRGIVGTGLGLWITKQLIEMMKGNITVDSIEAVGTEFTVTFPALK